MDLLSLETTIARAAPAVLQIALFRSLPVAAYALVSTRLSLARRAAIVATVGAATTLAYFADARVAAMVRALPILAAYMIAGAVVVHAIAGRIAERWARRGVVLFLAALAFLAAPAACGRHPLVPLAIVLGWELMLSAHSYAVETVRAGRRPPIGDALFFLLVNPTVIYAERGAPIARAERGFAGVVRIALGTATMFGRDVALMICGTSAALVSLDASSRGGSYVQFCVTQALLLLGLYCAHAGLARVQIGWMRVAHYEVPERYRFAVLARDPQDFWHRWNIWVSRWASRYLYMPLARAWARGFGARRGAIGVAALVTFAIVGLLHDFPVWMIRLADGAAGGPSLRVTFVFVVFGASVVAWGAWGRRLVERAMARAGRARRLVGAVYWAAWINYALAMAWLALPVFRQGRLPEAIEAVVAAWKL